MNKVFLDGALVDASSVYPGKHRYVGQFRPPSVPDSRYVDVVCSAIICPCSSTLWTLDAVFKHYQLGHMDTPQYVTICTEPDKEAQK